MTGAVKAIILAGSRPGGDPLAEANSASVKSLIPLHGKPMLCHVASSLLQHGSISEVEVLAQDPEGLETDSEMKTLKQGSLRYVESHGTIAATIENLLDHPKQDFPLLVTTADNALLSSAMIDQFLSEAGGSDVAVGVVAQTTLIGKYPDSRRTWLTFSDENYSGANLFLFGSAQAKRLLHYWAEVEQDRKKGWRMLSIFGPWLLLQVLLRRLTIDQMADRVGQKLGLGIRIVKMQQAEACIDVDTQSDLELVEKIMLTRQSSD